MNQTNTTPTPSPSLSRTVSAGTLWGSSSSLLLKGFTIIYLIVVLKQLSLYQYGVAELVLSIAAFMGVFVLPGLHAVVIADMSRERGMGNEKRSRAILHDYVRLRYVGALIPWALLFFGAEIATHYYNEEISTMVRLLSFTFLTGPIKTALQILFRVQLKFKETAILSFFDEGYKLLIAICTVLLLGWGPLGVIVAYVFSDLLSTITALAVWRSSIKDIFPPFKRLSTDGDEHFYSILLKHGKWGIMTNYLGGLGHTIRLWIVKFLVGTEAVALLSVAHGLFLQTCTLFPLTQIIAPLIYEKFNDHEKLSIMASKGIKYQLLGYAGVSIGVVIGVPAVVWLLFPHYWGSLPLFFALLPALVPVAYSSMFTLLFVAKQKQRNLFEVTVVRTVCIILFAPVFVYFFGVLGAPLEILFTVTLFAFERYRKVRRLMPDFTLSISGMIHFDEYDRQLMRTALGTWVKYMRYVPLLNKI